MTGKLKGIKVIVVCGPTASGKSNFAINLAKKCNAEIVNIDSVQVYKDLDIGSGKITLNDQQEIPHHLIDIKDPDQPINVAEFIKLAEVAICDIISRGKNVVIVAGTSLYIKCLFHGILDAPGEDPKIRERLDTLSLEEIRAQLQLVDKDITDSIKPNDRQRMTRALEVFELTGQTLSSLQKAHGHSEAILHGLFLLLSWPREKLYDRIDTRCKEMIEQGLLNETENIIKKYGADLPALKSLGYAQATSVLNKEIPKEALLKEMATKTRQFAKRQLTFWRNQPIQHGYIIRPKEDEGFLLKSTVEPKNSYSKIKDSKVLKLTFAEVVNEANSYLNENLNKSSSDNNLIQNECWAIDAGLI